MKVDEIRTPTQAMNRGAITLMILGIAYGCYAQGTNSEHASTGTVLKSIAIHQEVDFKARPELVYEALMYTKQFSAFSGRQSEINREAGGAFSLFNGHIIGRNLELIPNKRIVQAWRVVDWPEGVYSIARFELKSQGSGTHLIFDHIGFPEGLHDHLAEGWEANYWTLLKKYFG